MMLPIDITARSTYRTMQNQLQRSLQELSDEPAQLPVQQPDAGTEIIDTAVAAAKNDENPAARRALTTELRTFVENAKKNPTVDDPPPPTFIPPRVRL